MDRMERVVADKDTSSSERNPRTPQALSEDSCSTFIQRREDARWSADARAVLALQRHAGNKAVAALIQRRRAWSVPVQPCGGGSGGCCDESHEDDQQKHRERPEAVQRVPDNESCQETGRQTALPLGGLRQVAKGQNGAPTPALRIQRQKGPVIQRYGHAWSCSDSTHLQLAIWPGHFHAKMATDNAIRLLNQDPIDSRIAGHIQNFFGHKSLEKPNLDKIRARFQRVTQALDQQYMYHCGQQGGKHSKDKKAFPCTGQHARTDDSSPFDITLCFDRLGTNNPVIWAAWLIIHENVHRTGLFGVHVWRPEGLTGCTGPALYTSPFVDDNPDSYACFAILA